MKKINHLAIFVLSLSILACSDSDSPDYDIVSEGIQAENEFVHKAMLDRYFWYDNIEADIDYAAYESPQATLLELRSFAGSQDRFSYIANKTTSDSLFNEGEYHGFGFAYYLNVNNDTLWMRIVYTESPAGRAGLQRSDQVLS